MIDLVVGTRSRIARCRAGQGEQLIKVQAVANRRLMQALRQGLDAGEEEFMGAMNA